MSLYRRRRRLASASAVIGVLAGVGVSVPATSALGAPAAGGATPSGPSVAAAPRVVTLPTGDHVLVAKTAGRPHVTFVPAAGHSGGALISHVGNEIAVVPADAVDQLHSTYSLESFAVATDPTTARASASAQTMQAAASSTYTLSALRVKVLDWNGQPLAHGLINLTNVDNNLQAHFYGDVYDGDFEIAVPPGHYAIGVSDVRTDSHGKPVGTDLLINNQFTISGTSTSLTLDDRKNQAVSVSAPQPTVRGGMVVSWQRNDAAGNGWIAAADVVAAPGMTAYVTPAPKASVGTTQYGVWARQVSPASASSAYSYEEDFPIAAAITATGHAIDGSHLAELDTDYRTDQPSLAESVTDNLARDTDVALDTVSYAQTAPLTRREFFVVGSGVTFSKQVTVLQHGNPVSEWASPTVTLTSGQHTTSRWFAPAMGTATTPDESSCGFCRSGNTVTPTWVDGTDSDRNTFDGNGTDAINTTDVVKDNGTTVKPDDSGNYVVGSGNDVLTLTHSYTWSNQWSGLSTSEQVTYTVHSSKVTSSNATGSSDWGCDPCSPLAVLYAHPHVEANAHDSVPGNGVIDVVLAHDKFASDPAVSKMTVNVSYDDGKTWTPASVALAGHKAKATFTVPSSKPRYLSLRVQATDAAGATVDERVIRAALVNAPNGIALPASQTAATTRPLSSMPRAACADSPVKAHCLVQVRAAAFQATSSKAPDGYSPTDLQSAYNIPKADAHGRTVAVVDVYDYPEAESDLAVYRKQFGLPPCTTANGCFRKVNQNGKSSPLPDNDDTNGTGWSAEDTLDLDMVSAMCPTCRILFVEANSEDMADLATAERTAGASALTVSNSWSYDETRDLLQYASSFSHPGVAYVAASDDFGYQQSQFPSSLDDVIAVGGTVLTKSSTSSRGWTEKAWSRAGSGCSAYDPKPSWQHDTACPGRTVSDISATADTHQGVAVYWSFGGGWEVSGGTSAGTPIIASLIALRGNSSQLTTPQYIYRHTSSLFDPVGGNNNLRWNCRSSSYMCNGVKGYDAPTGMGSPNGLGAL